jgi:hypothetical protein
MRRYLSAVTAALVILLRLGMQGHTEEAEQLKAKAAEPAGS